MDVIQYIPDFCVQRKMFLFATSGDQTEYVSSKPFTLLLTPWNVDAVTADTLGSGQHLQESAVSWEFILG